LQSDVFLTVTIITDFKTVPHICLNGYLCFQVNSETGLELRVNPVHIQW